jgi:small subunit ribosomal protein S24e
MRRLVLFLQHRQRPLMSFDPSQRTSSSSLPPPGTKRPFAHQAAAVSDNAPSSKAPRIDFSQRSPRRNRSPSPHMSSQQKQQSSGMSSSRGQGSRSKMGGGFGFGHKFGSGPSSGPSFSKSQKKRPQKRLTCLEGPFHNEEYVVHEHKKSPVALKPLHESTPKSSLGNFSMLAAGKTPIYTFTEGYIFLESGPTNIWRCVTTPIVATSVFLTHCPQSYCNHTHRTTCDWRRRSRRKKTSGEVSCLGWSIPIAGNGYCASKLFPASIR